MNRELMLPPKMIPLWQQDFGLTIHFGKGCHSIFEQEKEWLKNLHGLSLNSKIQVKRVIQIKWHPNLLIIEISPNENVSLQLNSRNPMNGKIEPVKIGFSTEQKDVPEAYERLIYDAIRGDSTFFAHWKEVELSWEWVQPILEAFKENLIPLYEYPAGSNGPEAANRLLEKMDSNGGWMRKVRSKFS